MRRRIKSAAGRLIYASGAARALFRERGVVVLFHRVDDALPPNPTTCTRSFFRDFCRMAKRHFVLTSFSRLLDNIERGESVGGQMVISFDDGYEDNLIHAAPILAEFDIQACFFIATGFIGTSRVPWWDEEWGITSKWMNWSQVRELGAMGHEIGAHTHNHIDLSIVTDEEARLEIGTSKSVLERELGEPIDLFSYPYGRVNQITEANREMVRELGFRCCPSAYGGSVRSGDDTFRLYRQPISPWFRDPYQFAFEFLRS